MAQHINREFEDKARIETRWTLIADSKDLKDHNGASFDLYEEYGHDTGIYRAAVTCNGASETVYMYLKNVPEFDDPQFYPITHPEDFYPSKDIVIEAKDRLLEPRAA